MIEALQEFVDSRGAALRVDRQQSVIRGVKVLGLESRNGRSYLPEALSAAAGLYEGAKVNVNHPKGSPLAPRDYQERIGVLRGVTVQPGEGLFAELHFNPKHALAEQLLWDAEHNAEHVGLSHNVEARTARQGDRVVVEAILKVQSVDLVADPATTRGLFESSPLALDSESQATLLAEATAEIARLRAEVERLQRAAAVESKRRQVRGLLAEFELPDPEGHDAAGRSLVDPSFLAALMEAADEAAMRRLVEERARLVAQARRWPVGAAAGGARPLSRDQALADGAVDFDARGFARAIR